MMRRIAGFVVSLTLCMAGWIPAGAEADELPEWGIYVYMCGSDLESVNGSASADLFEMLDAELSEDVTIVVETGGASEWQNEFVDPAYLERYVISASDAACVDQQPLSSMGDPETFAEFLTFCTEQYPAKKQAVILWDHGGGSIEGAAYDELYDYEGLSIAEMKEAFGQAFGNSSQKVPLEMVGFDACLMATIETADMLQGYAGYMVASEEMEPGCGWNYGSFLNRLSEDTSISGNELGELICDSYLDGCKDYGDYEDCTLSVVDVAAAKELVDAYDLMGTEALLGACEDSSYPARFGRGAESAENYGLNTESGGYSGMVDLGDLAVQNQDLIPESYEGVIDALNNCVLYTVSGTYKTNATGISCYYALDGNAEDLESYTEVCASDSFCAYYDYMLTGELEEDLQEYISEILGYEGTFVQPDTISTTGVQKEDLPVTIDEDGYAVLKLDEQTVSGISDICFDLVIYDEDEDILIYLGSDNDMEGDYETGVFRDNFRGVWGCLDGCLCHMEVSYACDDYTFYSIPILLNGEEYCLKVVYDYGDKEYHILGASKGIEDNGMADKNTMQLKPGDKVTTIHYVSSISGDEEPEKMEMDEITVTEDTAFTEEEIGDGQYLMMFCLKDVQCETLYSQAVNITIENGQMSVDEEAI